MSELIFVAHDVGGPGGMERVSAEIVRGALAAGWRVTVVARRCALEPVDGLTFVRVPTPARPGLLAYPAFFAAATAAVAWHRRPGTVVHTTGALVGNRAHVSTVHYCHHAAAGRVTGSRASRNTWSYRLNSWAVSWLSLAGERWAYQPRVTRVLCPVSGGVASELREHFEPMAGRVRTVPNGVDATEFRPDPAARATIRAELGLSDEQPLALFAGGDWERKGLRFAVDALADAPRWHLAVAGHGDASELTARARSGASADRLHLLGRRTDMPALYAAADAFVFPTAYEAFPLVTLEAAASGLPLLVTRVNGVEDVLRDGENGWFVTRDAGDIATRLNALDAGRGAAMGASARVGALEYSWEATVERYLAVYADVARR